MKALAAIFLIVALCANGAMAQVRSGEPLGRLLLAHTVGPDEHAAAEISAPATSRVCILSLLRGVPSDNTALPNPYCGLGAKLVASSSFATPHGDVILPRAANTPRFRSRDPGSPFRPPIA